VNTSRSVAATPTSSPAMPTPATLPAFEELAAAPRRRRLSVSVEEGDELGQRDGQQRGADGDHDQPRTPSLKGVLEFIALRRDRPSHWTSDLRRTPGSTNPELAVALAAARNPADKKKGARLERHMCAEPSHWSRPT